jgi:hypothetical protein
MYRHVIDRRKAESAALGHQLYKALRSQPTET